MQLVDITTGDQIRPGDSVTTYRGEIYVLRNFRPPHKPGSTGRVGLDNLDGSFHGEFFPGVINARIEDGFRCYECGRNVDEAEAKEVIFNNGQCPTCGEQDIRLVKLPSSTD